GPLAVPVWYRYEPGGDVRIVTGGGSREVRLLLAPGRMTLCAQEESPPYRYLTLEGPITIARPDFEAHIRGVAIRYLGERMGEQYLRATAAENEAAVLISLRPERWLSADFSKFGL